jgi:hypothetical protein
VTSDPSLRRRSVNERSHAADEQRTRVSCGILSFLLSSLHASVRSMIASSPLRLYLALHVTWMVTFYIANNTPGSPPSFLHALHLLSSPSPTSLLHSLRPSRTAMRYSTTGNRRTTSTMAMASRHGNTRPSTPSGAGHTPLSTHCSSASERCISNYFPSESQR